MFDVYAVVLEGEIKHRSFIASEADLLVAKQSAKLAVQSFADYAYVSDTRSRTVFVFLAPDYDTPHNPNSQVIQFPKVKLPINNE